MTAYQWTMVSIAAAGFLLTAGGTIAGCVWAVAKIKAATTVHIQIERKERAEAIDQAMRKFDEHQIVQDHNFGEMGLSLRRFIEQIEKKVYEVELFGRDNFARKDDVADVRKDIKEMRAEIRADIKDLGTKVINGTHT